MKKSNTPYQFQIGDLQCTLYHDTDFSYQVKDYFSNVDPVVARMALNLSEKESTIPSPYVALLIESKDQKILIDTGLGAREKPLSFRGHTFKLEGTLIQQLEKDHLLDQIDCIIITHLHPDHAGGLFNEEGNFNFPNAEIIIHQKEWDYWNTEYPMGSSPVFDYIVKEQIFPLKEKSPKLISGAAYQVSPELKTIFAPGHTPGHICVQISSKGENLLYISDTWLHPLHIKNLDWQTVVDLDHQQAKQTRMKMLEMAHDKSMLVQSFHFDFPGIGRIHKVKDGWNYVRADV